MPLREEFFENLMLRATPFIALNDPFEGKFNDHQFRNANRDLDLFAEKQGYPVNELSDYELEGVMGAMETDFDNVGVLAFSEDFTNPLMWAHYADQHRGIVIELDYDKPLFQDSIRTLGNRKSRFGKNVLGDVYEFPEKVMYRREMPSFLRPGEVHPDTMYEYPWKKFLYALFFTKSNDWIYEKELRSIVQLKDADSVICKRDKHLLEILFNNKEIEVLELDDNRIQIVFPHEYEMHEDMGDESVKEEISLHINFYRQENINLFRINPEAISGIYCGYRCDCKKINYLINKNKQLEHLKNNVYHMEIDPYCYQLRGVPIGV